MLPPLLALLASVFLIGYGLGGRAKDRQAWKRGLYEPMKKFHDADNPPGSL